jgi:hypothetical protein
LLSKQHLLLSELNFIRIILGQSSLLHHGLGHHKLGLLLNSDLLVQLFLSLILNSDKRIVILLKIILGLIELLNVKSQSTMDLIKKVDAKAKSVVHQDTELIGEQSGQEVNLDDMAINAQKLSQ